MTVPGGPENGVGVPPPPPGSSRPLFVGLAIVVALGVIAVVIDRATHHDKAATDDTSNVADYPHVTYLVGGTATGASLTLSTPTGSTQIDADVPLTNKQGTRGLRYIFQPGQALYLSAQNDGSGEVTCRILVDGVEVSSNTASGDYAIATCQGST